MPAKRDLAENEVKWIVDLYKQPMGMRRIEKITGISIWSIRAIIQGRTYTDITGGIDLRCGWRAGAVWRHSTRTYEEVMATNDKAAT